MIAGVFQVKEDEAIGPLEDFSELGSIISNCISHLHNFGSYELSFVRRQSKSSGLCYIVRTASLHVSPTTWLSLLFCLMIVLMIMLK